MTGLWETWLKPNVFLSSNEASPPDYTTPMLLGPLNRGGGVALILNYYLTIFNLTSKWDNKFNPIEALVLNHHH